MTAANFPPPPHPTKLQAGRSLSEAQSAGVLNIKGCIFSFFRKQFSGNYLNWYPFKSKSQALVFHLAKYESISDRAQMLSEPEPQMRIM